MIIATRPWVTPTLNPCKNSYDKHFANGITYLQVVLIRKARVVIAARDFETRPQVTPAGCQALLMITAKLFWRRYYVPACISYKESEGGNCRQDKTSSDASQLSTLANDHCKTSLETWPNISAKHFTNKMYF